MSSRCSLRRKVVLPVTLMRNGGQERQLAHTLDLTETTARLGGLASPLTPGEIIELYRGARKARFEVVWMGEPYGAMAGQAGVRNLEPNKTIWNVSLPMDEMDCAVPVHELRTNTRPIQAPSQFPGEKRWHPRFPFMGSNAVKSSACTFAINGEVKDISRGGLYAEMTAPLPVDSTISMKICIEGICFESAGVVRTSYPLLGMGISFQDPSPDNSQRLIAILDKVKSALPPKDTDFPEPEQESPSPAGPVVASKPGIEEAPAEVLARACRMLSHNFDIWERSQSSADVRDLRDAIRQLQRKLSLRLDPDLQDLAAAEAAGMDQSNPSVSPAL